MGRPHQLIRGCAAASRVHGRRRSLRLATPAVSLGSTDTLAQHPAGLTQRVSTGEARSKGGITPGLVRVSVGLEDADDLWADLRQAIERGRQQ